MSLNYFFYSTLDANWFSNSHIDKVSHRLSSWKARTLSFGGGLTLAKSILQAMSTKVVQLCSLPKVVCDVIDSECMDFVWGDENNNRKMHLLNWGKVCQPKKEGGLGLRPTLMVNSTFMMKPAWSVYKKPNSLWAATIRGKHKCNKEGFPNISINKPGLNVWRGICKGWDQFRELPMCNGETIRFWNFWKGC